MDDYNKQGMSPARRRAERMLRAALDEFSLNREQEKQREAMAAKAARLRELRLAKESAERDNESSRPLREKKPSRAEKSSPADKAVSSGVTKKSRGS